MALCQQCGTPGSGRFCAQCGATLEGSADASIPLPADAPVASQSSPKRRFPTTLILVGVFVAVIVGAVWTNSKTQHPSAPPDVQSASDSSDSSDSIPSKSDELADAKRGPSATQMAGNANKWRGSYVHFPCKITNVIEGPAANAMCGRGITAKLDVSQPNDVDYSDPNAVNKAIKESQENSERQMQVMQDQAMVVLVGDKVGNLDGGQIVTITGEVMGAQSGQNAMGATLEYPTIRVDYAE